MEEDINKNLNDLIIFMHNKCGDEKIYVSDLLQKFTNEKKHDLGHIDDQVKYIILLEGKGWIKNVSSPEYFKNKMSYSSSIKITPDGINYVNSIKSIEKNDS